MKRKIVAITILSIVTGLILINIINEQDVVMEENEKQITNSNMLTMMLETEAGTGNYEETTASEWPQDGYVFNESYYNALSSEWQSLINENQIWQVGGMNWTVSNTAKQYYGIEVGNDQIGFEETMAIGLMYVSDYGYAASPENWQTTLYSYNNVTIKNNNWLYLGDFDWTISRSLNFTGDAFIVNYTGYTYINEVDDNYAIRPVFYLKSNATLMNGMGTSSDPYHITN